MLFFGAARFTAGYVRAVGQDVSPGKCVVLSTSNLVRRAMKLWDISDGFGKSSWILEILVVILILPGGLGAGTLSRRVEEATIGVAAVGALPLGFQVKLGVVRGVRKFLLVFMLLEHLMFLPPLFVLLGLLLFGRFGPVRCLLPALLRFLTCLTGQWV